MVYGACGDGTILDDNDDEDELKLRVKYKASRRMFCSNRVCKIMTRTPVAEVNTTFIFLSYLYNENGNGTANQP